MSYKPYYSYTNRTLCDILTDMRNCYKTYQFGIIPGLIEELQVKANRMEASLGDAQSYEEIQKKRAEAKDELRRLEEMIRIAENKAKGLGIEIEED